jgi:hypothetical protein
MTNKHLARVPGDVAFCEKVPSYVKYAMWRKHKDSKDRKRDFKEDQKEVGKCSSKMGGKESIYVASNEE